MVEAVLGFLFVVGVAAYIIHRIIKREKRLGNDIVQDVKDLVE